MQWGSQERTIQQCADCEIRCDQRPSRTDCVSGRGRTRQEEEKLVGQDILFYSDSKTQASADKFFVVEARWRT